MTGSSEPARWFGPPRGFGLAMLVLSVLLVLGVLFGQVAGSAADTIDRGDFMTVAGVAFTLVGALVVPRTPRNPVGWLLLAIGVSSAVAVLGASYSTYWVGLWVYTWISAVGYGLLPVVLLVFPDGRLVSRRWSGVLWVAGAGAAMAVLGAAVAAWRDPALLLTVANSRRPPSAPQVVARVGLVVGAFAVVTGGASLVVRWRRSDGVERQQLKWLALGAASIPLALLAQFLNVPGAWAAAAVALPAAVAIGILKHRLYDVDLFLNRSLVYATLTVLLVGGYVAIVATLGALFTEGESWQRLAAAGAVAVAFGPLRERIQRGANRLLFGDRDDPYAVVSLLSRQLEGSLDPTAVLSRVAETIADALHLPFASIELPTDTATSHDAATERTAASYGRRIGAPESFPMTYQGQVVGKLTVCPRSAREPLTDAERKLVEDLARHAGVAARTVGLTADLQRSRERLVRSREEERRRLRRDLHDGLGPALAGMTMQVGAARALVRVDRARVTELLDDLEQQLQACVRDIRQLVDDLHPSSLDRLGLARAIRARAAAFSTGSGLRIEVIAPTDLPELPAAVEVAAYRIATEALTNTVRHARAECATVRLTLDEGLVVEIVDDGRGRPADPVPGVGLTSMRERTAELGGDLRLDTPPGGGTSVRAVLPLVAT